LLCTFVELLPETLVRFPGRRWVVEAGESDLIDKSRDVSSLASRQVKREFYGVAIPSPECGTWTTRSWMFMNPPVAAQRVHAGIYR